MSLLLDLHRLRDAVHHVDQQVDPAVLAMPADDGRLLEPVHLTADAVKDGHKVRVHGRVRTSVELACSRCLEPLTVPVDSPFDLLFLPEADEAVGTDGELADEDASVSVYHDDQIDLAEVVREQLYLALPMKPLCREDCLGLCPVCGTNRNRDACACQSAWVDPRLDALRRLRPDS